MNNSNKHYDLFNKVKFTLDSYKTSSDVFVIDPASNKKYTKNDFYDIVFDKKQNLTPTPNKIIHLPVSNTVDSLATILSHLLLQNCIQLHPAEHTYWEENLNVQCDLIIASSGSTGNASKRIKLLWEKSLVNSLTMAEQMGIDSNNVHMLIMPLHHVNSLFYSFFSSFFIGQTIVMPKTFEILRFWSWVNQYSIKSVNVSPTIVRMLNARPSPSAHCLTKVLCASAKLHKKDYTTFYEKTNISIIQGYGLSECTNFSTVMPSDPTVRKQVNDYFADQDVLSIGTAIQGHQITTNKQGELLISSDSNFDGYIDVECDTQIVNTGDIGYCKEFQNKMYWFLKGRSKEIIKYKDECLYPEDIENYIKENSNLTTNFFCFGFENYSVGEAIGIVFDKQDWNKELEAKLFDLQKTKYPYLPQLIYVGQMSDYLTTTKKPQRIKLGQKISEKYSEHKFKKLKFLNTLDDTF